jgi:GcrA cell cycle regulator
MWAEGKTASQVSRALGGRVSRNAVVGKVHRLGLCFTRSVGVNRVRGATHPARKKHKPKPQVVLQAAPNRPMAKIFAEPFVSAGPELVIPVTERKTIATLEANDCRWPIGDPQQADFHFCGKTKVAGLPYCEFHARRAYQPPQVSRSRAARSHVPVSAPKQEEPVS